MKIRWNSVLHRRNSMVINWGRKSTACFRNSQKTKVGSAVWVRSGVKMRWARWAGLRVLKLSVQWEALVGFDHVCFMFQYHSSLFMVNELSGSKVGEWKWGDEFGGSCCHPGICQRWQRQGSGNARRGMGWGYILEVEHSRLGNEHVEWGKRGLKENLSAIWGGGGRHDSVLSFYNLGE